MHRDAVDDDGAAVVAYHRTRGGRRRRPDASVRRRRAAGAHRPQVNWSSVAAASAPSGWTARRTFPGTKLAIASRLYVCPSRRLARGQRPETANGEPPAPDVATGAVRPRTATRSSLRQRRLACSAAFTARSVLPAGRSDEISVRLRQPAAQLRRRGALGLRSQSNMLVICRGLNEPEICLLHARPPCSQRCRRMQRRAWCF